VEDGRGDDPLRDGHRRRGTLHGGRYLGLAPDLTSPNGEPPVELDWRAFCARHFPGAVAGTISKQVAYGVFRSSV